MQKKDLRVLLFLVLILAGGSFVFSWSNKDQKDVTLPPDDTAPILGDTLTLERSFADGVHTITGEITLPTPCHQLSYDAIVAESFPEQVTLNLTIAPPALDVMCIQVIATREFTIEVSASDQARFSVRLNGEPINVSIVETTQAGADDGFNLLATSTDEVDPEVLQ